MITYITTVAIMYVTIVMLAFLAKLVSQALSNSTLLLRASIMSRRFKISLFIYPLVMRVSK